MRAIVVCAYLGTLPAYLSLWLRSCAANPAIDWLLVTDDVGIEQMALPRNVTVRRETRSSLTHLFAGELGFAPALTTPYKLNDLKPLFFTLVEPLAAYDYWGFCDLDVCFGNLAPLRERMGRNDMILTEGHFRLIHNTPEVNALYRSIRWPRRWDDILRDPVNAGMDEHGGINRAFADANKSVFRRSEVVADLDPSFRQLRLLPQYRNYRRQCFVWEDGRVFREYWHRGRYGRDEFVYVHFQKRRLDAGGAGSAASIAFTPHTLMPRAPGRTDPATMAYLNPWHLPNRQEVERVVRMRARQVLRPDDLFSSTRAPRP